MILNEPTLPSLGLHLMNDGLLDKDVVYHAANHAKKLKMPFISYLVRENILTSEKILFVCQKNIFNTYI